MTANDQVELARNAKAVTTNRAFIEAWARLRERIVDQIEAADPLNKELIDTLKRHLTTIKVVRRNLELMIEDGVMAEQAIDFERKTLAQRAKSAVRRVVNG